MSEVQARPPVTITTPARLSPNHAARSRDAFHNLRRALHPGRSGDAVERGAHSGAATHGRHVIARAITMDCLAPELIVRLAIEELVTAIPDSIEVGEREPQAERGWHAPLLRLLHCLVEDAQRLEDKWIVDDSHAPTMENT